MLYQHQNLTDLCNNIPTGNLKNDILVLSGFVLNFYLPLSSVQLTGNPWAADRLALPTPWRRTRFFVYFFFIRHYLQLFELSCIGFFVEN